MIQSSTSDKIYDFPDHYKPVESWLTNGTDRAGGHVLLTGRAGSGKTMLLRKYLAQNDDGVAVLAPTGIAAVNIGGQTIHSFFKFPPHLLTPSDIKYLPNTKLIRSLHTLVIDEISMVRVEVFDAIDQSLRKNRNINRPFGGVRMILVGDLHQLPPVAKPDVVQILERRYGGIWFFNAPAFIAARFSYIALKHVFRQSEPEYLDILNAIRNGRLSFKDEQKLASLVSERSSFEASQTHIVLTPNNMAAHQINQKRLDVLPGNIVEYEAEIKGKIDEKTMPAHSILQLKTGARVMTIKNDPEGRWVNGSIGQVESFGEDYVLVNLAGKLLQIGSAIWETYRYVPGKDGVSIDRETIGSFKQIPLRLAYAITIHKSQGLTLERVHIDPDQGFFAHGQAYVALSRCRALGGLELSRPIRQRDLVHDRSAFNTSAPVLDIITENDDFMLARFAAPEGELI